MSLSVGARTSFCDSYSPSSPSVMHQLFKMYLGIFFRAILKASKGGNVNRTLLPNTKLFNANEGLTNDISLIRPFDIRTYVRYSI